MSGCADRVLSWNAKVHRDVSTVLDELHEFIENQSPHVICLQEFYEYLPAARDRFGSDGTGNWWLYAPTGWQDANNCPVMVRRASNAAAGEDGWGYVRTTTPWTGKQGVTHPGRTWTWVDVADLTVMSIHRCTLGDDENRDAFHEEHDAMVKWANKRDRVLMIGDHNCAPTATFDWASPAVADAIGGTVQKANGVDHAIKNGLTGTMRVLDNKGSDHKAILWTRD